MLDNCGGVGVSCPPPEGPTPKADAFCPSRDGIFKGDSHEMSSSLREEVAPYPPPRSIVISHFSDKIFQNFVRPSSIRPPKMRSFFAFLSVFLLSFCLRVFAV